MKRLRLFLPVLCGIALIASSCCRACRVGRQEVILQGIRWELVEFDGRVVDHDTSHPERFSFTLDYDGRLNGTGDCNRFSGQYHLDRQAGQIAFSSVVSTRMACPDGAPEGKFFRMMTVVSRFRLDERFLVLYDTQGDPVASFMQVRE